MKKKYIAIFSLVCLTLNTLSITAIDAPQLNNYFTRFKRGVRCLIKRRPCLEEDKQAVYQVGGALLILVGTIAAGRWVSTRKSLINPFLEPQERELLQLPLEQQQDAKNELLLDAVENSDLTGVKHWLSWGAKPNTYFDEKRKAVQIGKNIEFSGHVLNTAIHRFSIQWQQNEPREDAKQIIIELIKHGANSRLRSGRRRMGDEGSEDLSVYEQHKAYTPYFADPELDKILKQGKYP